MRLLLNVLVALAGGFGGAALWQVSGFGDTAIRQYLLTHPEILPQAMEELNQRETAARLAPLRTELETPFPGAVLGNPQGAITLVEFSDYACSFCRQSLADLTALIAQNPQLRVVIRELPILSEGSAHAARMALAAAQQGRYAAFHDAMFAQGAPSDATISAAAAAAGVDLTLARAAIARGDFEEHLSANMEMAETAGFSGTPSWVVGNRVLSGAVGLEKLREAVNAAKPRAPS